MKRTDFQCVVEFICNTLDSLYECVKDKHTTPEDKEAFRKDLTATFHFLDEAKQHGFTVKLLYKWEDIKNECI